MNIEVREETGVVGPTEFCRDTISLTGEIHSKYIELASRLSKIRGQHLWKNGYESFAEFLDAAKLTKGTASKLIQVYENFLLPGQFTPAQLDAIPYSSLYEAIPLLRDKSPQEVVEIARSLTRDEIKSEVKDEKYPDCSHVETIVICVKCHRRVEE